MNDHFFDSFDHHVARRRRPTRPARAARIGIGLWFAFCALTSLALVGVFVWAIITLVTWVVA